MSVPKKFYLAFGVLGIFLAIFYSFYLQSIPYEVDDAVTVWRAATQLPWHEMALRIFRPVSEFLIPGELSWETALYGRITELVLLKALFLIFGDSLNGIHAYTVVLVILLSALVMVFVFRLTGNWLAAFFAALFLTTTPAYAWTIMEFGDSAPADQVFLLVHLVFFYNVLSRALQGNLKTHELLLLWVTGMLAIRVKESNVFIAAGVPWLMLLANSGGNLLKCDSRQKTNLKKISFILFVLSLPLFLLKHRPLNRPVPWESLKAPFYIFFQNPFGWEAERVCCLFSWKRSFPVSILSNFGFFLSWTFIVAGIFLMLRRKRFLLRCAPVSGFMMCGVWSFIALAFHIYHHGFVFTRYLTWALLPFTLAVTLTLYDFLNVLDGRKKKIFAVLLIVFATVKIGDNFFHSLYIRQELEKIWVPKWAFRKAIYEDQTHRQAKGLFDLYGFWHPSSEFTKDAGAYLFYNKTAKQLINDAEFKRLVKKYRTFYFSTSEPAPDFPWSGRLLLSFDDSSFSLLTRFKMRFSGRLPNRYYLYKVAA